MNVPASYRHCEGVARAQAKNFYFSFLLLDKPRRQAMCAIYAFMRYCDDLSDAEGIADRAGSIEGWRKDLEAALAGHMPTDPLWPAFADAVDRYRIPHRYFFEMIEGVRSDLEPRRFQTFDELYAYCYHVASVVGLTIIHIFGFEDPKALGLAETCGIAFQLTNILRDVREDALNGRVYWPQEDLQRFGVPDADLHQTSLSPALRQLLQFEAQRAAQYYRESSPLVGMIDPQSRASMRALIGIYIRLLKKIQESGHDVMSRRLSVPGREKLWILLRSRWS